MDKICVHHKKRVYLLFLCSLFGILSVSLISSEQLADLKFAEGVETAAEAETADLPQTLKDYEGYLDISLHELSLSDAGDLKLYVNGDKAYYFLPACARAAEMFFRFDEDVYEVAIDGTAVVPGEPLASCELGREYEMHIVGKGQDKQEELNCTLTLMQSESLPAVFIETMGDIEELNESLENEDRGEFLCVLADGSVDSQGFLAKMNSRGNASFAKAEKKSYQIRFFESTDVLHMGSAYKYILQANALDPTYLRNKVVYDYCKEIGVPYVADSLHVDLYLNGEYAGNYLVCERVEFGESRIDVKDGYLLEKMMSGRIQEDDVAFQVEGMENFIVREPLEVSEEEAAYISDYMNLVKQKIDACITKEDYEELKNDIDVESFANMYLIDAVTNNIDSNIASTFYYKVSEEEGGKLYAGPYWDYDNAFGRHDRGYLAQLCAYPSGYSEELFAVKYFRELVVDRFNESAGPVMQRYIDEVVPSMADYLQSSREMDICRWEARGHHTDLYSTYEEAYPYLLSYMQERLDLVADFLNYYEDGQYHRVIFVNTASLGYRDTEYWIKDGETIPDEIIREAGDRFYCEEFLYDSGKRYQREPVSEDTVLYGNKYKEL